MSHRPSRTAPRHPPRHRAKIMAQPGGCDQDQFAHTSEVAGGKGAGNGPAHRIADERHRPVNALIRQQFLQLINKEPGLLRAAGPVRIPAPVKIIGQHACPSATKPGTSPSQTKEGVVSP